MSAVDDAIVALTASVVGAEEREGALRVLFETPGMSPEQTSRALAAVIEAIVVESTTDPSTDPGERLSESGCAVGLGALVVLAQDALTQSTGASDPETLAQMSWAATLATAVLHRGSLVGSEGCDPLVQRRPCAALACLLSSVRYWGSARTKALANPCSYGAAP